jgi:hypothetical protein
MIMNYDVCVFVIQDTTTYNSIGIDTSNVVCDLLHSQAHISYYPSLNLTKLSTHWIDLNEQMLIHAYMDCSRNLGYVRLGLSQNTVDRISKNLYGRHLCGR